MIASPLYVYAADEPKFDPFGQACDGSEEAKNSTVCKGRDTADPNPIYGDNGIINKVANILAAIAGVVAVVIIMVSGLKMITSNGDSKKLTDARNAIIYACIGIVVIILARVIIGLIMGRL